MVSSIKAQICHFSAKKYANRIFSFRRSNPKIKKFANDRFNGDYKQVESYYVQKLLKIMEEYPSKPAYIGKKSFDCVIVPCVYVL